MVDSRRKKEKKIRITNKKMHNEYYSFHSFLVILFKYDLLRQFLSNISHNLCFLTKKISKVDFGLVVVVVYAIFKTTNKEKETKEKCRSMENKTKTFFFKM